MLVARLLRCVERLARRGVRPRYQASPTIAAVFDLAFIVWASVLGRPCRQICAAKAVGELSDLIGVALIWATLSNLAGATGRSLSALLARAPIKPGSSGPWRSASSRSSASYFC